MLTKGISRYVMPLWTKGSKNKPDLSIWEETKVDTRYLSGGIRVLFTQKVKQYKLSEAGRTAIELPKGPIKLKSYILRDKEGKRSERSFDFEVKDAFMTLFNTGLGFITVEIVHSENASLEDITDFNFNFSRILIRYEERHLLPEQDIVFEAGKRTFDFVECIKKCCTPKQTLIMDDSSLVKAFHFVSHPVAELADSVDGARFKNLGRGINTEAVLQVDSEYEKSISEFFYTQAAGIYWAGGTQSVACFSEYVDAPGFVFVRDRLGINVMEYYFLVYLYSVHLCELMDYLNTRIASDSGKYSRIVDYRNEAVKIRLEHSQRRVSEEPNYIVFYDHLNKLFDIDGVFDDIESTINAADEYQEFRRGRESRAFSLVLSIFGIIGIVDTSVQLLGRIAAGISLTQCVVALVEIAAFLGCAIYAFGHRK